MSRAADFLRILLGESVQTPEVISRVDALYNAIITEAVTVPITPITPIEKYLAYLIDDTVEIPTPQTRIDHIFYEICLGHSKNIFDFSTEFAGKQGLEITGNEVTGTARNFYIGCESLGSTINYKTNTAYTVSLEAYTDGNASKEDTSGLYFTVRFIDNSKIEKFLNNSTQTFKRVVLTTDGTKKISKIEISYGHKGDNIWHIKNFQIEEGETATEFEPFGFTISPVSENETLLLQILEAGGTIVNNLIFKPKLIKV